MLPQHNDQALTRLVILAGFMLVIGMCLTPAGLLLLGHGIAVFGILLVLLSLGVLGLTVGRGLWQNRQAATATAILPLPECKVIAKFGINHLGETIFAEEFLDFEDPSMRLYVKLAVPDGKRYELKTDEPVWRNCGEGMRGRAELQGDWLASFAPHFGDGTGNPHRPE